MSSEAPLMGKGEHQNDSNVYKLISNDDHAFIISEDAMKLSKTLAGLIQNIGMINTADDEGIPVANVSGKYLELIVKWCEYHKRDAPSGVKTFPRVVIIPEWDLEFFKALDNEELFELILATNYLDIDKLMDYACKTVSSMAAGKTPEELRVIFGIPTDAEDDAAERVANEPEDKRRGPS